MAVKPKSCASRRHRRSARWLVPRLKGWRLRHPSIHLDLCNEQEADDLLQGRSDLAFYFGRAHGPAPNA
jgi:DNA-binding transcriptional LysR family regulator